VTLRERDSQAQVRMSIAEVAPTIKALVEGSLQWADLFEKLNGGGDRGGGGGKAGAAAAEDAARPWLAQLVEAKKVVIDPNMPQLRAHLMAMRQEQLEQAARDVRRMPANVQASYLAPKAASAKRVLAAALDDVEGQFNGGLLQVARPLLQALLLEVSDDDDEPALCQSIVAGLASAHRTLVEGEFAGQAEMVEELRTMVGAPADNAGGPYQWLATTILGNHPLEMPDDQYEFLTSQVAIYLDPFIDGEVPPSQYNSRSAGYFLPRLEKAWAEQKGGPLPETMSPEHVLTQYVRHLLIKTNMQLGFGMHIPGLGRQPIPPPEQERHLKLMCAGILEAVTRDFPPDQRKLSAQMPALQSNVLLDVSREHLRSLFVYQNELGQALAIANRDGEEARRQERLRIWGYC